MTLKSKPSSKILGYREELHSCMQNLVPNSQNGSQCAALGAKAPHRENGENTASKSQLLTSRGSTGKQTLCWPKENVKENLQVLLWLDFPVETELTAWVSPMCPLEYLGQTRGAYLPLKRKPKDTAKHSVLLTLQWLKQQHKEMGSPDPSISPAWVSHPEIQSQGTCDTY